MNLAQSLRIGELAESTRFPPMWPGFDSPTRRHMRVEFVVGSRPSSFHKNQHF